MNVILVSSGTYPNGGAATNRHLAYAKGLCELGHSVEFILLKKQAWSGQALFDQGIKFTKVWPDNITNLSKIKRAITLFNSIKKTKQIISSIRENSKNTRLILLDTSIMFLISSLNSARKNGIKVFHERTEYPFVVGGKNFIGKVDLFIYLNFIVKKFDGIFVINQVLKKYFLGLTKGKARIEIINMIVDPTRFELAKNENANHNFVISYCGSIEGEKDGVLILIEAFSLIACEFPKMQLQIISSAVNKNSLNRMKMFTDKLGVTNKVLIVGPLLRNEIPQVLCDSDYLALARPNNIQAEGGFPTKLGEYLATGNPVIVSNVGEIGLFLKDGVNAFVSEPDSPHKFAEKLREAIISNNSKMIGVEGKKLVYDEFNYLVQAKKLETFLELT